MEENRTDTPEEKQPSKLRGLYRYVHISVPALNWIIVACVAVILVVFLLELPNLGFTVTFDSKGGSDVPAQTYMYGDKLELPEPPAREGYTFTGWYTDASCQELWDTENRTVEADVTLYAGWQPNE